MMKGSPPRILFWVAFAAFAVAMVWGGYYHLFGAGFFRPILVTEKRILYVGEVLPDSLTEIEFAVTNGGLRPLRIESVRSGCAGCVEIISYPNEPLGWNKSAPIRVVLDADSLKGKVRKSFLIISNDPVRRVSPMLIDAVVVQPESETPESAQSPQKSNGTGQ